MRIDLYPPLCDAALLANVADGALTIYGRPQPPRGIAIDSRAVQAGDLFAALPGRERHGRAFIASALQQGASAILTDAVPETPLTDCAIITVPDVSAALLKWAAYRRSLTGARVIGVSGSAGKTTTKEGIACLCRTVGSVAATAGNYNSTVGMPLSVLSFAEADFWVTEIGISHPGEMAPMAAALSPDLAVLTNVGRAHIGHFKDSAQLIAEKAALACGMKKDGILLVPDDLKPLLPPVPPQIVTFGANGDFTSSHAVHTANGVTLTASGRGRVLRHLFWPLPGCIGAEQVLRLFAVGVLLGMNDENIRAGIAAAGENAPRLRRYALGERLLIDDAYNASPEATTAALQTLSCTAGKRPAVAVLGDMLELGACAEALHEEVGQAAARAGLAALYCCGRYADAIAEGARRGGLAPERIFCTATVDAAALADDLLKNTPRDAVILFKASHATGLYDVVEAMRDGG